MSQRCVSSSDCLVPVAVAPTIIPIMPATVAVVPPIIAIVPTAVPVAPATVAITPAVIAVEPAALSPASLAQVLQFRPVVPRLAAVKSVAVNISPKLYFLVANTVMALAVRISRLRDRRATNQENSSQRGRQ